MIYFSEQELDALLLEDIYRGDVTTRGLNLSHQEATMVFRRKHSGVVAGIDVSVRLLQKLGLTAYSYAKDGDIVDSGFTLIEAKGSADKLHQGWKVVQLVLEWCCGVAQYTHALVTQAKAINPNAIIACTRKSIPGTRKLATLAVLAGGGHIHRAGISETVLVFTNHRRLLTEPNNYAKQVQLLRQSAPENKITIEADSLADVVPIISAKPDIIQLDKFSIDDVNRALELVNNATQSITLSIAGGVNIHNIEQYASTGVNLFITSAPYYAQPTDIKVIILASALETN
ncbi:ModD protein [Photobacterium damselae]|uniref:ModD protein n=1 Tax=Photobacterium damselae TaxID=38293 RepID=UPI00083B3BFC|nr:ModD protein [Photobacterium damselae]ODA23840.1 ModD protein [Photobacterium damselae subsp. damselae]TLS70066.1 ModD protein [Photobacterium damselae subsp. damselae]TLS78490.1 ModD protein [Photobacterium damselae subsp. damselae]TLS85262.1 ModD protein [Photobacterium damselae subsp. damselae]